MSKPPHAPWFEVYYRTITRKGCYSCRACGCRIVGLFDNAGDVLATKMFGRDLVCERIADHHEPGRRILPHTCDGILWWKPPPDPEPGNSQDVEDAA
jgi:hypothetical protein